MNPDRTAAPPLLYDYCQLNDIRLVGRLTLLIPKYAIPPKGVAVARLDIAVNRRYKDGMGEWREEATFVPVTVWRETAERCRERLKKGSPIYVEGRLRSTSWETKDIGQKRTGLEVESVSPCAVPVPRPAMTTARRSHPAPAPRGKPRSRSRGVNVAASSSSTSSDSTGDEIPF